MYTKPLVYVVVVLLILTFSIFAFAQAGPAGMARQFTSPRVQARLNLTPEQMKQIQQVFQAQRANAPKPAAPAVNAGQEHRALMKAIFTDTPDQAAIQQHAGALNQAAGAQSQQHAARLNQAISTMLEINKILTPEQRAEFQRMLDENARAQQIRHRRMQMRAGMRQNAVPPPSVPKEQ